MKGLVGELIVSVVKGVIETAAGYGHVSEEDIKAGVDDALNEIIDIDIAEMVARANDKQVRGTGL